MYQAVAMWVGVRRGGLMGGCSRPNVAVSFGFAEAPQGEGRLHGSRFEPPPLRGCEKKCVP